MAKKLKEVQDAVVNVVDEYRADTVKQRGVIRCFIAGAMAGAVSRTAVTPLTVVKSVSQLRLEQLNSGDNASWKESVRSIYRAGGFRMFWLGNAPALLRVAPLSGLKFALFEPLYGYFAASPDASHYRCVMHTTPTTTPTFLVVPLTGVAAVRASLPAPCQAARWRCCCTHSTC